MTALTVLKIVRERLIAEGYDGLVSERGDCACLVGDLAPCNAIGEWCESGHRVDGCSDDCGDGCDWHVVVGKRGSDGR